jgi:hypothetical protein
MSEQSQESTTLLEQFTGHLSTKRYSSGIIKRYSAVAGHFLLFLEQEHIKVTTAQPQDIAMYLKRELKLFHQHHARAPFFQRGWQLSHTTGIHEFMRMLNGQWPPISCATTPVECFIQQLCQQFKQWLANERALAITTISDMADEPPNSGRFVC